MPPPVEGEVHFETALQETGQPATVVRDGRGQLLYPGFVPPAPQSPGTPSALQTSSPASSPSTITPARSAPATRPKLTGKSASDAPQPLRRQSSAIPLPSIKRAGTNASQLQHALWTRSYDTNDSSSSDSSSDEDDQGGPSDGVARTDHAAGHKLPRPQKGDRFRVANDKYTTKGKVSKRDGRLAISIKDISNDNYLPKALGAAISKVVPLKQGEITAKPGSGESHATPFETTDAFLTPESFRCPRLNIVIMVIGSRGDAQPFLKIGKVLKEKYGHRVRIATHPAFREFVEQDSGLEFFSVGGDPSELMAFMVKNPGLIPTIDTLRAGDIGRRRAAMNEMFGGFWRACVNATDDEKDVRNLRMMGEMPPFVADAIIANPASFAHVHCAEALGIPLILSFTFPYTPTRAFPHPMANVKRSNVDPGYTNFISYPLVEMMIWQGLGDLVNDLRVKTLWLDPVSTLWAPGSLYRMNVPFAYLWSPSLVPKPADWGDEIDICGFVFLDLASSFTPPNPLEKFLSAGAMPIYIGFGSIVVDDANSFTKMIFEAVKLAGVRALVSKGWGGLGGDELDVPDNVFLLDNTPHDWLFPRVRACVIHGGAGTTAIALKCGKPTMVVPFFGDQFFWGNMIARAKAGPEPVPHKQLSVEKLAEGIQFCLTKEAQENAQTLSRDIAEEGDGADNMCAFFHTHLPLSGKHSMRCSIFEDRVAVWHMKGTSLRLSALAADILVARGYVQWRRLRLIRHCEWNDFAGPGEPVTGVLGSVATSLGETFGGIASVPAQIAKHSNKKRRKQQRKSVENEGKASASKQKQGDRKQAELAAGSREDSKVGKGPSDKLPVPSGDGPHDPDAANDAASGTTLRNQSPQAQETKRDTYVSDVSRGALKSARALASAPIDLSIALAQGFHNAPRLYGDDTVRRPPRVTGIKSGLRAARSEFTYGFYDAWTGVVRLPVRGAKKNGAKGFAKGVGMGLGGLVLKELAAVTGPFGYTLKGLKKQAERRKQPYKQIRRARILQGQRESKDLCEQERRNRVYEVERSWRVLRNLMETVEKQGKEKGILRVQLSIRRHLVGEAYESVQMAESVLEAVCRGEDIKDVMEGYRRSESAEVA